MVHIPKQVEYALMVLSEMQYGQPGELFQVRKLTTKLGIPFDVTSKAMQAMARAGLLTSVQGKYGGYQIALDLQSISLEILLKTVVGPTALAACLERDGGCIHMPRCVIRKAVSRLDMRVRELFLNVSINDLIA